MVAVLVYAADTAACRRLESVVGDGRGICNVGSVQGMPDLERCLAARHVDVVLAQLPTDARIGELTARLRVPVVALVEDHEDGVLEALHDGARSALPHKASVGEIRAALLAAAFGLSALPYSLLAPLLSPPGNRRHDDADDEILTAREIEVLAALADGEANKMIARRFGISVHTVKYHVASILAKLDAESRTEAVAKAARMGLVII
jgi:DNA-binding NarL/FixJ family response regulator